MNKVASPPTRRGRPFPQVLPMRQRADVINRNTKERLETIVPIAMREQGLDMWIVLCQEDDLDPVFKTMIPMDTWCPILQMLVFFDRGKRWGIERINISGTKTKDWFDRPYIGELFPLQWKMLKEIVKKRDPKRIGINTGDVQWACGGLTHNLYNQLCKTITQKYARRLESAEPCATRYLATLTQGEIECMEQAVAISHEMIAECYSRKVITPGVTTTDDLVWHYWQKAADNGLGVSFRPFFYLRRSDEMIEQYGEDDKVIRPGDFVRCDLGVNYLRFNTDHQEWMYCLKPGETDAPQDARDLMAQGNQLQDIFMDEFEVGLTGDELLKNMLTRAKKEKLPGAKVYSHNLGLYVHEPGPLIGLPWEQKSNPGRGDVKMEYTYTFTAELHVKKIVPWWSKERLFIMALEQAVVFTPQGCRMLDGRQTEFYLV
jgi:Xaa-Pro aminopeptidase